MSTEALTKAQERALQIVKKHGPVGGSQFGDLMWPEDRNDMTRSGRRPQGSGFAGGGYLAKLARLGLVQHKPTKAYCAQYVLTSIGRAALATKENKNAG